MYSLPTFSFSVDHEGIVIEGLVSYCSVSDVNVEITSPYQGLSSGLHTMYMCLFPGNRNLDEKNELSEKGKRTITSALISAYEEADFLYRNRAMLYQRIVESEEKTRKLNNELERKQSTFTPEKKKRKELFKQGKINEKEYKAILDSHRVSITSLTQMIKDMERNIFSGFPEYQLKYGYEIQNILFVKKYFDSDGNPLKTE